MQKTNSKPRYVKPQSVKMLETLSFETHKRKFTERNPGAPTYFLVADKYRDDTANGLTKCILAYIRLRGGQAERISTTGRVISSEKVYTDVIGRTRKIGSSRYIPGTSTNGSADISSTINGISVKVEVKIGRDRQSEAQIRYQNEVEQAGGLYCIARDFDGFLAWYNDKFGGNE